MFLAQSGKVFRYTKAATPSIQNSFFIILISTIYKDFEFDQPTNQIYFFVDTTHHRRGQAERFQVGSLLQVEALESLLLIAVPLTA